MITYGEPGNKALTAHFPNRLDESPDTEDNKKSECLTEDNRKSEFYSKGDRDRS